MAVIELDRSRDGIALLTLNRPEARNAMNAELIGALHDVFGSLRHDTSCRVIVLTGAGAGFCAGLDLKQGATPPAAEGLGRAQAGLRTQQSIAELVPRMRAMPQPIISAVNGAASGGGLALALASDIRVASTSARFNVAFVRVGLSGCDIGVSWLLPRLIGASRAYELMLTGRFVDADEALRIGLVARVVPDDRLLDAAFESADQILANSPFGVHMTKEVMWSQLEVGSLVAGIDLENRTQLLASTTEDMQEALAAFVEKRPPEFRRE
ncbi:MAG TPA: enoyl-CoA hydratase-related protein [Acidimicrobiales bacterium]|nr:enoyl-CoA hydratase-related protein [Acidimicrobiales bacterium]